MKRMTLLIALIICMSAGMRAQKSNTLFYGQVAESLLALPYYEVSDADDAPKFTITGKVLTVRNLEVGAVVDIYSVLGAKVYSFTYTGAPVQLQLSKGIYIIRVDKFTQKIIL